MGRINQQNRYRNKNKIPSRGKNKERKKESAEVHSAAGMSIALWIIWAAEWIVKRTIYQKPKINGTGGDRPCVPPLPGYLHPLLHLMTDKHDDGISEIGTSYKDVSSDIDK